MSWAIVQVVAALLIIFFLPGFMLVNALFPKKNELDEDDDFLYRIVLGIGLSIVIAVLNGFILGSIGVNPDTGKGYFTAVNIWATHLAYTVAFFIIGYYRGAYPLLGRGVNVELDQAIEPEGRERMYDLMTRWKDLKVRLDELDKKAELADDAQKGRLETRKKAILDELREVDLALKRMSRETHLRTAKTGDLQELVHSWRRLRQEMKLCDDRIKEGQGKMAEHYRKRKEKLQRELDEIDEKILKIRGEG